MANPEVHPAFRQTLSVWQINDVLSEEGSFPRTRIRGNSRPRFRLRKVACGCTWRTACRLCRRRHHDVATTRSGGLAVHCLFLNVHFGASVAALNHNDFIVGIREMDRQSVIDLQHRIAETLRELCSQQRRELLATGFEGFAELV